MWMPFYECNVVYISLAPIGPARQRALWHKDNGHMPPTGGICPPYRRCCLVLWECTVWAFFSIRLGQAAMNRQLRHLMLGSVKPRPNQRWCNRLRTTSGKGWAAHFS